MSEYIIMIVLVSHRKDSAKEVQTLLTKFGCSIKMRLGLHEASTSCAEDGLIVLQLTGDKGDILGLERGLNAIDGVKTKIISMNSD